MEGEKGEACKARALDLLRAPEAVLLERLGRSIAVSVSMQVELLSRLSPNQRASILAALRTAADERARPAGDHRGAKVALSDRLAGGMQARVVGPHPPAINEGKMSDAEFEAARVFAERLIAEGESAEVHRWVLGGRRLVSAVYLIAGRESGKEGDAREDYARQLLRLPDDELIAKLQASNCVTAVLEGKRLAEASASEVASILAVVGLVA